MLRFARRIGGVALMLCLSVSCAPDRLLVEPANVVDPNAIVVTGIRDIRAFLDVCPTADPAIDEIRARFALRSVGEPVAAPIVCVTPFSRQTASQLSDELIALQVLRTAFHMSSGTERMLPWTTKSLWAWMTTNVRGINLKASGLPYCCDRIAGQLYVAIPRLEASQRLDRRTWAGITTSLATLVHEIRHSDVGAPAHTVGCPAFPQATGPAGCDAQYDLARLGAYGVQYWLHAAWGSGRLRIGIGCAPESARLSYLTAHAFAASLLRQRFVRDAPPDVIPPATTPC